MTESDDTTIAYYDKDASRYADMHSDPKDLKFLERFMDGVPVGGTTCDLGSGNGWAAAAMRNAGFAVTAIDGSAAVSYTHLMLPTKA